MKLNGKEIKFNPGLTLKELLLAEGFLTERIIVEYNGRIVPGEEWADILIVQNDVLEVLSFVGGG